MSVNYTPNIGELCHENPLRDAMHFAVAPVEASVRLRPGCHVGLTEDGEAEISSTKDCIGIVDPFLKEWVEVGQRFWLFLYPNTITGLRHVWSHSAFRIRIPNVEKE